MPFNINELRGMLGKRGVQRLTNYAVNITPPSTLLDEVVYDIPLMCDTAYIPGTAFNTDTFKHKGYGLEERRPNGIIPEDLTLTFIGDAEGKLVKFFDKWGNKVMNSHTSSGPGTERFGYPVDYYGTLDLYMYDIDSSLMTTYTMQDAWPTNIGNVQVGWNMTDQFVIIPVTFTYRQHLTHLGSETLRPGSHAELSTITGSDARRIAAIDTAINPPSASEYAIRLNAL